MEKCEECLNSRLIVSENGFHVVCTLSQKAAIDCLLDKKNHFVSLKKEEGDFKNENV